MPFKPAAAVLRGINTRSRRTYAISKAPSLIALQTFMNDQLHAPALDPVATSAAIGTEVTTDAANVADGRDRGRADVTIGASPKNIDGVAKIDYAITREVLRPIPDCIVGRCAYSEQQVTIQSS